MSEDKKDKDTSAAKKAPDKKGEKKEEKKPAAEVVEAKEKSFREEADDLLRVKKDALGLEELPEEIKKTAQEFSEKIEEKFIE